MTKGPFTFCARCGCKRAKTRKEAVLCVDCRYVLSEEERKAWEPMMGRKIAA